MELIIGYSFLLLATWLGYRMGRGEALEVKLPEKLKAIIRGDDEQAIHEQQLEERSKKK